MTTNRGHAAACRVAGLAGLLFLCAGCGFFPSMMGGGGFLDDFPPEVLEVPNTDDVPEEVFSTTAVDVNEAGTIIGFTNSSGPFLTLVSKYADFPVRGFAIHQDDSGFVDLTVPVDGITASWPHAISDSGLVVGTYLVTDGDGTYVLHAYSIRADGTEIRDLHPSPDVSSTDASSPDASSPDVSSPDVSSPDVSSPDVSSAATHVNGSGRIFGIVEDGDGKDAVEFASDGSGITLLAPNYAYSYVQAVSNTLVVLSAMPVDGDPFGLLLYSLDAGRLEALDLAGVSEDTAFVEALRDDGRMVGWYTDVSSEESFGDVAFIYVLGDIEPRVYRMTNRIGDWDYLAYRFHDFTDSGTIVGIGFRIDTANPFPPQARAVRIEWDFTGFKDITPPNGETYSEVYAVTEAGTTVGYGGFSFGDFFGNYETTINRAFTVTLE